jgi:hypothetical protein
MKKKQMSWVAEKMGRGRSARSFVLCLIITLGFVCHTDVSRAVEDACFYYHPATTGSDAYYSPLNSFVSYCLDTTQVSESFDIDNFVEHEKIVRHNLSHPWEAIKEKGGTRRFINRQIFPCDKKNADESWAMVPNYFLHLLGGGMVYRRDYEYFKAHGYYLPGLWAASIAMGAEYIQEVVEKKSTGSDDEIADIFIFRPLGILLFSSDTISGFINKTLAPSIWSSMVLWDFNTHRFMNSGISYIYRPDLFRSPTTKLFVYTGMNNLIGLSHAVSNDTCLSWGTGFAIGGIDMSRHMPAKMRNSAGFFYDKKGSLLWSIVINGTENYKARINVYPFARQCHNAGFFCGLSDTNAVAAGLTFNFPVGAGFLQ